MTVTKLDLPSKQKAL